MATVKRTERGWPGHFICADRCLFRRNTLLEGEHDRVIVSTVGAMLEDHKLKAIGAGRYYETVVFGATEMGEYVDANITDQRYFNSEWSICANSPDELPDNVDNKANEMHEAVVDEFIHRLGAKR